MILSKIQRVINAKFKGLGFVAFFCFSIFSFAQQDEQLFSSDLWHQGEIIFKKGDTLKGLLFYNLPENILLYQQDGKQKAFYPKDVRSFDFIDSLSHTKRHFSTQRIYISEEYQIEMYFEVLSVGGIYTLFTRERIQLSRQAAMASQGFAIRDYELGYDYYYLLKGSLYLIPLRNSRKGLYKFFGLYKADMKRFMKKNKYRYSYTPKEQMISIFGYFEKLIAQEQDESTENISDE
ncbi:MAG: hypothetical protein GY827_10555 [Cytophagales bacterium]|nr:hypothetical protein [Cytophagales bacterium]